MIFSGFTERSFSIKAFSQPARGGSRMTVWSGSIKDKASSDLEKMGRRQFSRACGRMFFPSAPVSVEDVIRWEAEKACFATFSVPSGIYVVALAGEEADEKEHSSPRREEVVPS